KIFGNEICEGAHYKSVLASTHSSAKELVKEALERYGLSKEEAESYILCDTIGSIDKHQWRTEGFRVVGDHEKPLLLQSLWKPREGLVRRFEIQRRRLIEEKISVPGYDSLKMSPEKDGIHGTAVPSEGDGGSQAKTETLCVPRPRAEREGEESEREETESSDDNTTQYSIHPPHDCPYLLLLQGCSLAQDFVIYLLAAPHVVVGQQSAHEDKVKTDIPLFAGDILPKHCSFQRHAVGGPIVLRPCPDAVVTRNGDVLKSATRLSPGDLIGMGKHYLFLFRDPLIWTHKVGSQPCIPSAATPNHTTEAILCNSCISSCTDHQSSACDRLTLGYQAEDEDRLVREIVAAGGGGSVPDRPPLTVSFLLSLCVQYSASCLRTSDLRRLLLLIASGVQSAMWVSRAKRVPLVHTLVRRLSCVRSACEETTAVLEEVILLAFQQCVYYITKLLHPVLPGLLDCNPFRESPDLWLSGDRGQVPGSDGLRVTGEIWQVVEVLNESWRLLLDCQVHREVSSQLIGYLFYFVNASLFNSLMERGSEPGFYQWFRGVQMRASLDLVLDWGHAAGLGELALEHTHTLSSAINLLATPRKNLLQTSWASLRAEYPALSPAQLNHLLSLYSPASPCTHMWTPSAQDQAATHQTADILESFDTHHPLVLPDEGYRFQLRGTVADSALRDQLHKLKEFIASPSDTKPDSERLLNIQSVCTMK
uniref:Si:ch211-176g6.2 n=1 Tax=Kryptolebias marmoratus TaxID=37003 RepID=A0A3Q2ZBL9_KRYMA